MSNPSVPESCFLYSLNDRPVMVGLGSFGDMQVNPKPENAPWGVTIIESRVAIEDRGDDEFIRHDVPGRQIAEDIVNRYPGEGFFLAEKNDGTVDRGDRAGRRGIRARGRAAHPVRAGHLGREAQPEPHRARAPGRGSPA